MPSPHAGILHNPTKDQKRAPWDQGNAEMLVSIPPASLDERRLRAAAREGGEVGPPRTAAASLAGSPNGHSIPIAPTNTGPAEARPHRRDAGGTASGAEDRRREDEEDEIVSGADGNQHRTGDSGGGDEEVVGEDGRRLSAYELLRLRRVRRNEERLRMLGLAGSFAGGAARKAAKNNTGGKKRQPQTAIRPAEDAAPNRRSNRPRTVHDYKKLSDGTL